MKVKRRSVGATIAERWAVFARDVAGSRTYNPALLREMKRTYYAASAATIVGFFEADDPLVFEKELAKEFREFCDRMKKGLE